MGKALDIIKKLSVVEFDWKENGNREIGLIAEEVEKIFPESIWYKDGRIEGLKFLPLIGLLVKSVQELTEENSK